MDNTLLDAVAHLYLTFSLTDSRTTPVTPAS